MNPQIVQAGLFVGLAALVPGLVGSWVGDASERLAEAEAAPVDPSSEVAIAQAADDSYCSLELKKILRRVLTSCGLLQSGEVRGCQPLEAQQVAALSGGDFNALFQPLADRAGIVQFDLDKAELDDADKGLVEQLFADQRGASYFFVVARSSPEGRAEHNRELSEARGKAVLDHLRSKFQDHDLDREVGLLWLGEEFAQLDDAFCAWKRSGGTECLPEELNRSAFAAWIDCRL